jgi:hypothetical protein
MTDRPILFSAEMVRAILDGRKTQTRRMMKVQPWPNATVEVGPYHPHWIDRNGESQPGPATFGAIWDHQDILNGGDAGLRCPYGAPGDLLWVRETCAIVGSVDPGWVLYRASGYEAECARHGFDRPYPDEKLVRWRPSIHMPRWASRITLRITDIRVERLQDIEGQHASESDAIAEGVRAIHHGDGQYYYSALRDEPHPKNWGDPADAFQELWNKINGPGAWKANPWVWVVSFERVKP